MYKLDLIKCILVILTFLTISDDEYAKLETFDTPSNNLMNNVLARFNFNMVTFTEYLNNRFNNNDKLWNESPKEFFSNKQSIQFFINMLNLINKN